MFAPAMAQQALPAQLEGIVADAALRAIPNCAITIEADSREVAKARSDGSGSFFVGKVPRQRVIRWYFRLQVSPISSCARSEHRDAAGRGRPQPSSRTSRGISLAIAN
ncbi:MAG TPA: hypothetical protein VFT55_12505, partial [Planctomycetota bacterium]|nr:hypothetical protein [Planctomycetota bacterium]